MPVEYATAIQAPPGIVRRMLRDAAFQIVQRYGCDVPSGPIERIRFARHAGFTIVYYRAEPGSMSRRGRGNWNTPPSGYEDAAQEILDIDVGEHLAGLGWRGTGPIISDRLIRGPWELELLRGAGMSAGIPDMARVPPTAPASVSRVVLPMTDVMGRKRGRLSHAMAVDVIGYTRCIPAVCPAKSSFADLVDITTSCYRQSRTHDGEDTSFKSSFALKLWAGREALRDGVPFGRPTLSYWIAPHGGAEIAAKLMLALDLHVRRTDAATHPKMAIG